MTADDVVALRERISRLEAALRPFVESEIGYTSGMAGGARWCAPKVTLAEMDAAREALA